MRKAFSLPALFTLSAAFILCCSSVIFAQNREKFVISAKAGGINAITGQADVHAKGESDWQQLSITDDLEAGDRVRTANDGRVEILLNPGSYLRVGGDSEVELSNNTLDNLELRLLRGTAIVEATGADGLDRQYGKKQILPWLVKPPHIWAWPLLKSSLATHRPALVSNNWTVP